MKKQSILSLILALAMALSLCACGGGANQSAPGSSSAGSSSDSASASASTDTETEQSEEQSVSGVVDEVKDFMFVIDADDGCFYSFNTDHLPADAPKLSLGDRVTITYEGTLTEVDNFTGKILSVTVEGEAEKEEETPSSLAMTDNGYVAAFDIGTECVMDLDGDGAEENIFYDVEPYLEGEDGQWTETKPATLTINGKEFLCDNEENPFDSYGFWIENPSNGTYYVVDLDTSDGMLELCVTDWGSNDWLMTHLFRYQNETLEYIGYLPAFPDSEGTFYDGQNGVVVFDRLNIMQTWSGAREFVYQDGTISKKENQLIAPVPHESAVYLRKPLVVYTEANKDSEPFTMEPSDQPVELPLTDDEHWVNVILADGTEGWAYFTETYHLENGDEVVDAQSVFDGLVYAG